MFRERVSVFCLSAIISGALAQSLLADPYASEVIKYTQGTGLSASEASYNDPTAALGEPARFTGQGTPFPSVVSVYSPAFSQNQLVSLGQGGVLTLKFNQPITDDASHPFGVDLLVFGNAGFGIDDFPNLTTGTPATLFGDGLGKIELSADGVNFFEVPNILADQLFPTQGYTDSGAFDSTEGLIPTNFQKPINPSLTLGDFSGKTYAQILAMYDGSGGGAPIDLASVGLSSASYVRISQSGVGDTEIDALVAIVPEPATALFAVAGFVALVGRSRKYSNATDRE